MRMPGFTAEATIYRSTNTYQAAWASAEAAGSGVDPMQVIPMLPVDGGICTPFCDLCESDVTSPTGCSHTCTAKNCNEFKTSCHPCSNPCEGGQFCGGFCKDTSSDPKNCGACGNVCPPGVTCQNGTCGCPPGQTICNGICTDTSSNSSNCGACGNACRAGEICQNGACVQANCRVYCSTWNSCNQTCGKWPPDFGNYQCWFDCLGPSINCLTSTCG
jgi:stigma-specific protein Stig1